MSKFLINTSAKMQTNMLRKAYLPDLKGGTFKSEAPPEKREFLGIMQSSGSHKEPFKSDGSISVKMQTPIQPMKKRVQPKYGRREKYKNNHF